MSKINQSKIDEEKQCSICKQKLTEPICLPSGTTLCNKCINQKIDENKLFIGMSFSFCNQFNVTPQFSHFSNVNLIDDLNEKCPNYSSLYPKVALKCFFIGFDAVHSLNNTLESEVYIKLANNKKLYSLDYKITNSKSNSKSFLFNDVINNFQVNLKSIEIDGKQKQVSKVVNISFDSKNPASFDVNSLNKVFLVNGDYIYMYDEYLKDRIKNSHPLTHKTRLIRANKNQIFCLDSANNINVYNMNFFLLETYSQVKSLFKDKMIDFSSVLDMKVNEKYLFLLKDNYSLFSSKTYTLILIKTTDGLVYNMLNLNHDHFFIYNDLQVITYDERSVYFYGIDSSKLEHKLLIPDDKLLPNLKILDVNGEIILFIDKLTCFIYNLRYFRTQN
jgi:hypothetical protein